MSTAPTPPPAQPKKKHGCLWAVLAVLALGLLGMLAMCSAVGKSVDDSMNAEHTVVYEVTGDAKKADLTYNTDGGGSMSQEQGVKIPWRKEVKVKGWSVYTLTAQNGIDSGAGKISCKITVDGKAVKEAHSSGQGALASCSANANEK